MDNQEEQDADMNDEGWDSHRKTADEGPPEKFSRRKSPKFLSSLKPIREETITKELFPASSSGNTLQLSNKRLKPQAETPPKVLREELRLLSEEHEELLEYTRLENELKNSSEFNCDSCEKLKEDCKFLKEYKLHVDRRVNHLNKEYGEAILKINDLEFLVQSQKKKSDTRETELLDKIKELSSASSQMSSSENLASLAEKSLRRFEFEEIQEKNKSLENENRELQRNYELLKIQNQLQDDDSVSLAGIRVEVLDPNSLEYEETVKSFDALTNLEMQLKKCKEELSDSQDKLIDALQDLDNEERKCLALNKELEEEKKLRGEAELMLTKISSSSSTNETSCSLAKEAMGMLHELEGILEPKPPSQDREIENAEQSKPDLLDVELQKLETFSSEHFEGGDKTEKYMTFVKSFVNNQSSDDVNPEICRNYAEQISSLQKKLDEISTSNAELQKTVEEGEYDKGETKKAFLQTLESKDRLINDKNNQLETLNNRLNVVLLQNAELTDLTQQLGDNLVYERDEGKRYKLKYREAEKINRDYAELMKKYKNQVSELESTIGELYTENRIMLDRLDTTEEKYAETKEVTDRKLKMYEGLLQEKNSQLENQSSQLNTTLQENVELTKLSEKLKEELADLTSFKISMKFHLNRFARILEFQDDTIALNLKKTDDEFIEEILKKSRLISQEKLKLQNEVQEYKNEMENLKKKQVDLENQTANYAEMIEVLNKDIAKLKNKRDDELMGARSEIDNNLKLIQELETQNQNINLEKNSVLQKCAALHRVSNEKSEVISEKEQQIQILTDEIKGRKEDYMKNIAKLKEENSKLEEKNANVNKEMDSLKAVLNEKEDLSCDRTLLREIWNQISKIRQIVWGASERKRTYTELMLKHKPNLSDDVKLNGLKSLIDDIASLVEERNKLKEQNESGYEILLQNHNRVEREYQTMRVHYNVILADKEKLKDVTEKLENCEEKNEQLQEELEKLSAELKKGSEKVENLTFENQDLFRKLDFVEQKLRQYEKEALRGKENTPILHERLESDNKRECEKFRTKTHVHSETEGVSKREDKWKQLRLRTHDSRRSIDLNTLCTETSMETCCNCEGVNAELQKTKAEISHLKQNESAGAFELQILKEKYEKLKKLCRLRNEEIQSLKQLTSK